MMYNNDYSILGGWKMAKSINHRWGNYVFNGKATDFRKHKLLGIIPFFSASFVTLEVDIKPISKLNSPQNIAFQWKLSRYDEGIRGYLPLNDVPFNETITVNDDTKMKLEAIFLTVPGIHVLDIKVEEEKDYSVILYFSLVDRDLYLSKMLFGIIYILIGAGLTFFGQWIASLFGGNGT